MEKHGFVKFIAANYSVVDQIEIFEKALLIFRVHGADFTNIPYALKNCSIIEINENNYNFEYFEKITEIEMVKYK